MKRKKIITFTFITIAFLLSLTTLSCNLDTDITPFVVSEYNNYTSNGHRYSIYTIESAPTKYEKFICSNVFYRINSNSCGNLFYYHTKDDVEKCLNNREFTIWNFDGFDYIMLYTSGNPW